MARISGVNIPDNKRTVIGLTYVFGIGPSLAKKICTSNKISQDKKVKELTDQELDQIRSFIDQNIKTEGDLKLQINQNIKRLKEITAYRGVRHIKKLPVRGQRTKTNARTKRGKRVCVGSGKKKSEK